MTTYNFASKRFHSSFPACRDGTLIGRYYQLLTQLFPDHGVFVVLLNPEGEVFVDSSPCQYRLEHPIVLLHLLSEGGSLLFTHDLRQKPYQGVFCTDTELKAQFFVCSALKAVDGHLLGCFGVIGEQKTGLLPDEKAFMQWLAENLSQELQAGSILEQETRQPHSLCEELTPYLDDIYIMADSDGMIISIAEQVPAVLKEKIVLHGGLLSSIFGEAMEPFFRSLISLAAQSKKKQTDVVQLQHQNTTLLYSVSCNRFSDGWYLLTFHDVTERNRLRELLESRKQLLEGIVQAGNIGVLLLAATGDVLYINELAAYWFLLDTRDNFVKIPSQLWSDQAEQKAELSPFQNIFFDKADCKDLRYACVLPSGVEKVFSLNGTYHPVVGDQTARATFFIQDVTERAWIENALKDMEQQMHFLLQASPVVIYQMMIPHGQMSYISPNAQAMLGVPAIRLADGNFDWQSFIHPDDLPNMLRSLQLQTDITIEFRFQTTPGNYRWLKDTRRYVNDEVEPCWIGALIDINDRKKAEQKQTYAKQQLALTLDSLVDAVITINQLGIILDLNPAACAMFGYPQDAMLGQNVTMLMPVDHARNHNGYIANYLHSRDAQIIGSGREVLALHSDGHTFPIALSIAEVGEGEDVRFIGCCHDLSLIKKQQEQLLHGEKLSAIGKLTSSLAHDFNNILGIVRGYAEMLLQESEAVAKLAKPIIDASDRASDMIGQLLDFSSSKRAVSRIPLNSHLIAIKPLLQKALAANHRLAFELSAFEAVVGVELPAFDNALINMVVNASHAMQGLSDGLVVLATSVCNTKTMPKELSIPSGDYACITITDNGCGMSDEVRQKIFEPFFTTKGNDGTGLGLAQTFGMVQRCHGSILVTSEPAKGSCFRLYFPCLKPDSTSKPRKPVAASMPKHESAGKVAVEPLKQSKAGAPKQGRILLVDDELELLEMNAMYLESAGYLVFKANSAKEAIKIAAEHPIDLLLSDIVMPQMNGFELAQQLKDSYPLIKIQLMSAFASSASIVNDQSHHWYDQRLVKPVSLSCLMQRVKDLMAQ